MKEQSQDETRWLLRLFAVLFAYLAVQGIRVQLRQISSGDDIAVLSFCIFIGMMVLLFWIAYKLWRCGSFWNILSWMPQTPPLFLYVQCQYFRMGQHIRCGLVGGMISLILEIQLPIIFSRYKGTWPYAGVGHLWAIINWPIVTFSEVLNNVNAPKEVRFVLTIISFVIYFFVIGLIFGWCISRVKQMMVKRKNMIDEPMAVLYNETDH